MRTPSSFFARVSAAGLIAAGLLGCGGSTPPPEAPESEPLEPSAPSEPEPDEAEGPKAMPEAPKAAVDDRIPDDYAMLRGDCAQLGRQLAALTRSDQLATLSPKLKEAQREQADKNITEVANKLGDKWTAGCEESLVGKIVDRKSLKCAMDARTVKEFDACLNAAAGQATGDEKK